MRIVAKKCILVHGKSFDKMDKSCKMYHNSIRKSFYGFNDELVDIFGEEYLCAPYEEGLKRILAINEAREFPGCVGS